jgi:hypothetical protein
LAKVLIIINEFLSRNLTDFHAALNYIWWLPYVRNSDRADFNLVFKEECGTCSTKHAALAQLVAEQNHPIFLSLGIYEMSATNTAGVGRLVDEFGLKSLPEAHYYLTCARRRFDVTHFSNEGTKPIENFLYEERISPDQIGSYKVMMHRKFFQNWMCENNLNEKFSFEELWKVREKCIAAFAQTA